MVTDNQPQNAQRNPTTHFDMGKRKEGEKSVEAGQGQEKT